MIAALSVWLVSGCAVSKALPDDNVPATSPTVLEVLKAEELRGLRVVRPVLRVARGGSIPIIVVLDVHGGSSFHDHIGAIPDQRSEWRLGGQRVSSSGDPRSVALGGGWSRVVFFVTADPETSADPSWWVLSSPVSQIQRSISEEAAAASRPVFYDERDTLRWVLGEWVLLQEPSLRPTGLEERPLKTRITAVERVVFPRTIPVEATLNRAEDRAMLVWLETADRSLFLRRSAGDSDWHVGTDRARLLGRSPDGHRALLLLPDRAEAPALWMSDTPEHPTGTALRAAADADRPQVRVDAETVVSHTPRALAVEALFEEASTRLNPMGVMPNGQISR